VGYVGFIGIGGDKNGYLVEMVFFNLKYFLGGRFDKRILGGIY